jgi:ribosomal protein S18 acetylase RimI-like enzyme
VKAATDRAGAIEFLSTQRRVFDRLDWWRVAEWARSGAWVWNGDAAMLAVPGDIEPDEPLGATLLHTAWLRWSAMADGVSASGRFRDLLSRLERRLAAVGVNELWCITHPLDWIHAYIGDNGFEPVERMLTYHTSRIPANRALPPGLVLRRAQEEDLSAMCDLDTSVFDEPWRYPPAIMRRALACTQSFDVAERSGEVLGYQCAVLGEVSGHVVRLAVRADMRGQGIATGLMAGALRQLRAAGANTFTLNTQQGNREAQAFYARHGFRALTQSSAVMRKYLNRFEPGAPR